MIAAGTRLGPYEVLAPIGAGGMGEVYRARARLGPYEIVAPLGAPKDWSENSRVLASSR